MSLNIASDPLNEMDYMANGLPSSALQFGHLKKFTIQNMMYKVTLADIYFYVSQGKVVFGETVAVETDMSIFH